MGDDFDLFRLEDLAADCSGKNQRRGQAAGKMTTATRVIESKVAGHASEIRMAGTGLGQQFAVVT